MYPCAVFRGNAHMERAVLLAVVAFSLGIFQTYAAPQTKSLRLGPTDIYPNSVMTPGEPNPAITQGNIQENICNPHWRTKLIRPPSGYTSRLKRKQLREYGDTVHQTRAELINPNTGRVDKTRCLAHSDNMACYEEDHLISLENGGDPKDPRNLWPEPYNTRVAGTIMGAHQKDAVEGFIHDEICYDIPGSRRNSYIPAAISITLWRGQQILAGDWYACYEAIKNGKPCK
jgi:hypothetical protein